MPLFLWPAQQARVCARHSWPHGVSRISRAGAAGWETADCVLLSSGQGWSGTRAEVAAKLAWEGVRPHKLRPRLGPRQQRLGCGCKGLNLTTCSISRDGKGARRQTILPPLPHTSYLPSLSPFLYLHAASTLGESNSSHAHSPGTRFGSGL